ncbi:MAG TPA: phospholipase D-like domain-containing protein [Candidatus Paceibacterota bacterium]|nr:phospholipase D-like domain-containing protein [Candidatus Paceibacterota bacterium]
MIIDQFQLEATAQRYESRRQTRERSERLIQAKRYLEVDRPERVELFLLRHGFTRGDAERMLRFKARGTPTPVETVAGVIEPYALERILGANDLMGVAFLESGLRVARTVGRIWMGVAAGSPRGYGTGFMVSPRLLLTNHHVLGDKTLTRTSLLEFGYEIGEDGTIPPTTTYGLDPDAFHMADRNLDYALVAVQPMPMRGDLTLGEIGWNRLIEEEGKAIVSQWINIIQHPNAEPKQLCLRENQLIDVLELFLHYKTDTSPGSSGSPVFNDRWEVVALHHSGVPAKNAAGQIMAVDGQVWRTEMGEHRIKWTANEGTRISRVIAHLRQQAMTPAQRRLFEEMFTAHPAAGTGRPPETRDLDRSRTACGAVTTVSVSPDGTATWTLPLSVSVRIGGAGGAAVGTSQLSTMASVPADGSAGGLPVQAPVVTHGKEDPANLLVAAQREFGARADVMNVRLGYVFKNGWITKERAIVVTVARRRTPVQLREARIQPLPDEFRGLPVEVSHPSIEDLVRLSSGPAVAETVFADTGVLANEITYVPPAGVSLEEVQAKMRVLAHVSPEEGWSQLSQFLKGTKNRLVIGMYDFGAPHAVDAVESVGRKPGFEKLTLVMQAGESVGSGTKKNDLKDAEVVAQFRDKLPDRFENAWVKTGVLDGWVASSYHIKVIVRDSNAFWLSSGNLQSSNQPKFQDGATEKKKALRTHNREWHAILEHPGLAQAYEEYLLHDFNNNRRLSPEESLELTGFGALPDLLIPESFFEPAIEEAAAPLKIFPPFDENRMFRVQPLLTPDNYHDHVLRLIQSANRELLIQNQTFNAPKEGQDKLHELMSAIRERQTRGVAVRIIFRLLFASEARKTLEALQDFGFDMNQVRLQKNCHTKGMIVDGERVLLGSQNLSNHGVSVNRDASLLFDDAALANYFRAIFEHDWECLARPHIGREDSPIECVTAETATPKGMIRLTWKDYLEML